MELPTEMNNLSPERTMEQTVSFAVDGLQSPSPIQRQNAKSSPGTQQNGNRSVTAFTPVRPVFTPKAKTPRGSQGHILLSPSRTITESLQVLSASTVQQLEEVWDEVGYNPEERASQISDLLLRLKDLCEAKISEEIGVADQFRKAIADAKSEIRSTSAALKMVVDPAILSETVGEPLATELESLEIALEDLRESSHDAKMQLKEAQDYLVASHDMLGVPLDETWADIESDLTTSRRKEFEMKVEEMKQEVSIRTETFIQIVTDCQHLMNELVIEGQNSDSAIDRRIAGSLVRSKDGKLVVASKTETESCMGISASAMKALTERLAELSNEKRQRRAMLQELGTAIAHLWDQLRISDAEKRAFTESVKGLAMETIHRGKAELKRLQSMKSDMMGKLISEARETIISLWEQTNATSHHRHAFTPFFVEEEHMFDDVLLEQHETYITELQQRLEKMKPIMRTIEKREEILEERMKYEELQKDPLRLQGRGSAMAKQLMEEEKMARRIKKDLPKFTKLLEQSLKEWKDASGEDFFYDGKPYVQIMDEQDKEWEEYKANELEMKMKRKQEQGRDENKTFGRSTSTKHAAAPRKASARPLGSSQLENSRVPLKFR